MQKTASSKLLWTNVSRPSKKKPAKTWVKQKTETQYLSSLNLSNQKMAHLENIQVLTSSEVEHSKIFRFKPG